jgi:hypothetical protein
MAIIRRKTRKKIGKQVRKLVKAHGSEVALGAATALVTTLINKATDKPAKKGKGKKEKPGNKKEKPGNKKEKPAGKVAKSSAGKKSEKAEPAA